MINKSKNWFDSKLDKSWHLLLYFDVILPALLFFASYILKDSFLGPGLAKLFHSYNLFIINVIPDPVKFIGIIGAIVNLVLILMAIRKKDFKDTAISIIITLVMVIYFAFELNYKLILLLNFANL